MSKILRMGLLVVAVSASACRGKGGTRPPADIGHAEADPTIAWAEVKADFEAAVENDEAARSEAA